MLPVGRKVFVRSRDFVYRRSRALLAACFVFTALALTAPIGAQSPKTGGPRLAGYWTAWVERISPLLTEEERLYFLVLEDDAARERFARAYWESVGEEALERWARNREDVLRLRSRSRARERVVQLVGKPGAIEVFGRCGPLRRLEIWHWEPRHLPGGSSTAESSVLVFAEATTLELGSFAPWTPGDIEGLTRGQGSYQSVDEVLSSVEAASCYAGGELGSLRRGLEDAISFAVLRERAPWPAAATGWLDRLRERDPPSAPEIELRMSFLGSYSKYTILHGRLELPTERLRRIVPGRLFDRVSLTGDVYREGRLSDAFSIVHHIAGNAPEVSVPIDFYRRLLPGVQRLHLRVADGRGLAFLHEEFELDVPEMERRAEDPAGYAGGLERLTRSDQVQLNTLPSVELLPPSIGGGGEIVLTAIIAGGPIAAVEFRRRGEQIAVDRDPPYRVEVAAVAQPVPILAVALDPQGRALAESERLLEPPERPFRVEFERAPAIGSTIGVVASLPKGAKVRRFECRRGKRLIHSSSSPPYRCPYPAGDTTRLARELDYLTARLELDNGEAQEDVVFLGPLPPDELEVQLGELYLSILDARGRPARGLSTADVRVWEAGRERPVRKVQSIDNLPLNVTVLIDVSSSMGRGLRVSTASAQTFFERVLAGDDVASLLAFNHDFHQLVPFTADSEALRHGATGLRAWGATRLHDAIVHALFQFSGRTSRRALIVLSDGSDVGSDFPVAQVAELALRAGVVVFPISLGPMAGGEGVSSLAPATGGRAFRVRGAGELPRVYEQIERELRAQYLIVFEPEGRAASRPSPVEVEVLRQGYRARDVRRATP